MPRTVPPLLGRQSLRNAAYFHSRSGASGGDNKSATSWTLQWENQTHIVTRDLLKSGAATAAVKTRAADIAWERHLLLGKLFYSGAEDILVRLSHYPPDGGSGGNKYPPDGGGGGGGVNSHRWRFVTVRYSPSKEARDAYLVHTKRPWAGVSMGPG